ncbi:MAG: hypothetical protein WC234_04100 [Endomicrobiaceae bacterium]
MSEKENLEAKYGRKKTSTVKHDSSSDDTKTSEENNNVFQKYGRKKETNQTEEPSVSVKKDKTIEDNIKDTLSQYNSNIKNNINTNNLKKIKLREESAVVKFFKAVIIVLIIGVASSIIIAFTMRPKINLEGEQIIEQIKKAETLYFTVQKKYHYFAKTNYDNTLGIDLNKYKYFTFYEVIPSVETNNYEVKLYGATNAFTITYYTVKAFIKEKI